MAGFDLGDIFVTFKAKTTDLEQGVKKISQGVDNVQQAVNKFNFRQFSANASQAFGSVANAIQGVATKAFYLATAGGLGIGAFVKSAADLQQTSKSFEVLTGSVDTANKLFSQLARYANTTPFEFPQIAKAGQILLGFGIQADQVFKRVTMLGDIAAATGADFESLALVFGQVTATGKLMGQDALQLINNKIPITGILAKKLGVSVQEVKKRMEEGAISAQLFTEALEQQTKKGGFAFQGTEILAQSLNGRLSTLKDTVLEFGRNLIGVKVDPQLGLVVEPGGIFDRFSQLVPKITQNLQDMTPQVSKAFRWIMDNGDTVKAVLGGIAAAFIAAKLAAIGFGIAAAANPITIIASAIIVLIGLLVSLQMKFDWIGKTIQILNPIITTLTDIFNKYMLPSLMALWRMITEQLLPSFAQIWESLKRLWDAINPAFVEAVKLLGIVLGVSLVAAIWLVINGINLAVQVLAYLASAIANIISWVSNLIGWFGQMYAAAYNNVRGILNIFGQIAPVIGGAVNAVIGWFNQIPGGISRAMVGVFDTIVHPFRAAFNAIADYWNRTVAAVNFKAPDWVPGMGGKGWSIPRMPHLALGTPNFRGGMATMNEFGPETAVLPKGTKVIGADQTRRNENQGGNTYIIDMSGLVARSGGELADIMFEGLQALDRKLGASGKPTILQETAS